MSTGVYQELDPELRHAAEREQALLHDTERSLIVEILNRRFDSEHLSSWPDGYLNRLEELHLLFNFTTGDYGVCDSELKGVFITSGEADGLLDLVPKEVRKEFFEYISARQLKLLKRLYSKKIDVKIGEILSLVKKYVQGVKMFSVSKVIDGDLLIPDIPSPVKEVGSPEYSNDKYIYNIGSRYDSLMDDDEVWREVAMLIKLLVSRSDDLCKFFESQQTVLYDR